MYARTVTVAMRPGSAEEASRIFAESVLPAARQQKGFKGAYLLADPDPASGRGLAVTLWETEADLKASESNGYFQQQMAKFAPLLAGAPVRDIYVVSVQG